MSIAQTMVYLLGLLLVMICSANANTEAFLHHYPGDRVPPSLEVHNFNFNFTQVQTPIVLPLAVCPDPSRATARFVRVCWSAVYPVDVAVRPDSVLLAPHAYPRVALDAVPGHVSANVPADFVPLAVYVAAAAVVGGLCAVAV